MKAYKIFLSFTVLIIVSVSLNAQNDNRAAKDSLLNRITDIDSKLKEFSTKDSTIGFSAPLKIDTAYTKYTNLPEAHYQPLRDANGLLVVASEWVPFNNNLSFRDTVIFEPAFLPVVFDGKILPPDLDFIPKNTLGQQAEVFHLISPDSTFAPMLNRVQQIEDMRKMYYMNNPLKIRLNAMAFKGESVIVEKVVEQRNPFKELISTDNVVEINTPDIEKTEIRVLTWIKEIKGEHSMQLSQQSFSDNWDGDNNLKLTNYHKLTLNFKRKKLNINNDIEWRLNLQKNSQDTVNNINILDDYLRTYTTVSIEVNKSKNWFYSTNIELKTPLFSRYKPKEYPKVKIRSLLSPFELNLGLGMRYELSTTSKKDKNRNFKLSADISLLSLNYKYVRDDDIDVTLFGIEEGDKAKTEYGSTYTVNLNYNRNKYTKFTSRIKYFTNYAKVNFEWENNVSFALNRYLAASLYLYLIYDDGVSSDNKDADFGYFKYNEMVGFGLTYTW